MLESFWVGAREGLTFENVKLTAIDAKNYTGERI